LTFGPAGVVFSSLPLVELLGLWSLKVQISTHAYWQALAWGSKDPIVLQA